MKQSLKSQIVRLNFLIERDDKILSNLRFKYSPPDYCCPSCACPEYNTLCDKNERREAWLKILEKKYEKYLRLQKTIKWYDKILNFLDLR
jgi:hypothetical protein